MEAGIAPSALTVVKVWARNARASIVAGVEDAGSQIAAGVTNTMRGLGSRRTDACTKSTKVDAGPSVGTNVAGTVVDIGTEWASVSI